MEVTRNKFLHPEAKKEVYQEYARLSLKFPDVPSEKRMELAKMFVRDLALADTFLLMGRHPFDGE